MFEFSPQTRRRFDLFKANRRGWWSLWIFIGLMLVCLCGELIANDKPAAGQLRRADVLPGVAHLHGNRFRRRAAFRAGLCQRLCAQADRGKKRLDAVRADPFSYDTINYDLDAPSPSPPDHINWLGTDEQARDVLARVLFGARISILFALLLTAISTVIGVCAGAIQGYYGGMTDLIGQRIQEIWSGLPVLYLLIILSGFVSPSFWWLLGIMALFSWLSLVDVVRAEFLRGRNLEYVKAARALGLTDAALMWRHILPNAMTSTLTYLPFIITGAIATLTALDFLGFGMPAGSASLGELIGEAKRNLQAPWLGLTAFLVLALILSLLVFIGEACRDAFDPRS